VTTSGWSIRERISPSLSARSPRSSVANRSLCSCVAGDDQRELRIELGDVHQARGRAVGGELVGEDDRVDGAHQRLLAISSMATD
jgi:hypothetical protein